MEKICNKLKELEITKKDFWNIDHDCANFLNMTIKSNGYKNILEAGTSNGYSGIWLALAAKETGGKVITIEFHQKRVVKAEANFKECALDDVITVRQGMACEVIESLSKEDYNSSEEAFLDFVFVDANKAQYIDYYRLIDPKLRKYGMIAFDNMISHKEKVAPLLEAIQNNPKYQIQMLNFDTGLLIALKL
ncbi:MAG: class I SAM-dependent methyltransferase [Candidatus Gastranaerophilales bacterium]|nr:class I SAM-dependent methyltransferase [Candidatus Gastranaerophilales bacterium]